ncbi:MAG: glycosyltransferase family 4 protein [Balneolaceae bacterium]
MKTLFIISTGLNKRTDEEIRRLELEDKLPRTSPLETELNTQLLDERYLNSIKGWRRNIYKWLPSNLTQLLEALYIHKQYDAVLSYYERVGLPFAYLQKLLGSKTPHILLTTWFSSSQKVWFLKRVQDHLAKIVTWSSNQYKFGVNELGIPPEKIKLIKRGVDQQFWRPIESQTNTICSAGMEMRDYPTLIQAMKSLDIPCHIATGEARGQLFNTVKDLYAMEGIPSNITIGEKKPTDLRQLYASSRFVVIPLLPTDTDNGLTVILEAMAMGKAVISSKVDGQIDVIKEGITGFYVPQGDPQALKEVIEYLWSDPEKAKKMGKAARDYIEEHHTLEQFVEAIKEEVSQALVKKAVKSREFSLESAEVEKF